ncbi:MAG: HAMP domain-containing sensor histidine kinase [Bacteroidota bacterium]|nr:HAMP domain-containing sensor histidine kinase [Bacteroidota bacterium]MDP4243515.1 HAMP domain-containing sensor histidine kinase [Bacteroidota bacterium]MDP4287117.1 HAMP domain-containing sensor histidine kinase [Bacteroidota bacterium]
MTNLFRDIIRGLATRKDPADVLGYIAEQSAILTGASGAYIERLEDNETVALAAYGEGLPPAGTRGPYEGSIIQRVIELGEPITVADVRSESRSILQSIGYHAPAAVLPLVAEERKIGALIVIRAKPFEASEIVSMQTLAEAAAIGVNRIILLQESERQRVELERSVHIRDQMVRLLAHDLRNPLNTVSIVLEAIADQKLPVQQRDELLGMAMDSVNRMSRMLRDLLDTAIVERTGELPLSPVPQEAKELTQQACEAAMLHTKSKGVDIVCDLEGSTIIHADRDRLMQVLTNLIDNAIKFTPEGGKVRVRTQVVEGDVRFTVEDTGPGIPDEYQDKIFEQYWQAPETAHLGTGLGLAIAKQIVKQHGGKIWVERNDGQGSTFAFTIPAHTKPELA